VEAPLATGRARLHLDATHPKVRRRLLDARQGHSNLGRALGKLRGGVAWDLTAGLGRDALSLAARGFEVLAVERDPIVFTLLEDVVDRLARHHEPWGAELSSRVGVWHGEASAFLAQATSVPDVVLLDPMFSEKTRRGQVKKDLAILQHLLGAQPGATEGLVQTLTSWLADLPEPPMVLVKRAKGAPSLWPRVDRKVGSGAVRFDVHRGPWSRAQEAS
jgi:16S rRNA (guanine1516-N2)-methyltransferase